MVHGETECPVVRVLNNGETKAIPLQRTRRAHYVLSPRGRRHLTMLDRNALNIGRTAKFVPNDLVGIGELEPAVIGVVPTKMRVEDVGQDPDVALAGHVPTADAKPRHPDPTGRVVAKVTQVPGLLRAGWHIAYRGLPDLRQRGGGRMPTHDRTGVRRPFANGPERLLSRDQQISSFADGPFALSGRIPLRCTASAQEPSPPPLPAA